MFYKTVIVVAALFLSQISALTEEPGFLESKTGWKEDWTHVHIIKALNILEPGSPYDESGEEVMGRALFQHGGFKFMKKCMCVNTTCGCCGIIPILKTNISACLDAVYTPGERGFTLKARLNNANLFQKAIGKCGDMCHSVPGATGVAKLCASLNQVLIDEKGMHGCVQVHLLLLTYKAVTLDFNCLRFNGTWLVLQGPSPNPDPSFVNINITPQEKPKPSFNFMALFKKSNDNKKE